MIYRQGDGRSDIHDWCMEFTAAGLVLEGETLLVGRDRAAVARHLPKLERVANFVETAPRSEEQSVSRRAGRQPPGPQLRGLQETRRLLRQSLPCRPFDHLYRGPGPADRIGEDARPRRQGGSLRAPRPGAQGPAAPDRAGRLLHQVFDPDGVKHGVFGAKKYGYFEAVCNHDAICFRVADDAQLRTIYDKIASIPGLRPYDLIITNFPSLDDMYERPEGLWEFRPLGERRTLVDLRGADDYGLLPAGQFEDARRSMRRILNFARRFRLDNNLTNFGSEVYQPNEPINCVYDAWGVPAALIRGLFEYLYPPMG